MIFLNLFIIILFNFLFFININAKKRPNLLFVIVDDLNDWVEPYLSEPWSKTPFLKEFTKESTVFKSFHASYPRCNTARNCLFFGKDPRFMETYWGKRGNHNVKKKHPEWLTLQEVLRNNGYWVGGIGKVFHGNNYLSMDWDYYPFPNTTEPIFYPNNIREDTRDYRTFTGIKYYNDTSRNNEYHWLENMIKPVLNGSISTDGKPWALFIGYERPHTPYFVPMEFVSNELPSIITPEFNLQDIEDLPNITLQVIKNWDFRFNKIFKPDFPELDEKNWNITLQAYKACVTMIDDLFNKTMKSLNTGPYKDDTITMFTSDHGYLLGEKMIYGKNVPWHKATHVPFFVQLPKKHFPKYEPGKWVESYYAGIDLFPSVLDILNIEKPKDLILNGKSFIPEIFNEKINDKGTFLMVNPLVMPKINNIVDATLVDIFYWKNWHLIRYNLSNINPQIQYELYGPGDQDTEYYNLAKNNTFKLNQLECLLDKEISNIFNITNNEICLGLEPTPSVTSSVTPLVTPSPMSMSLNYYSNNSDTYSTSNSSIRSELMIKYFLFFNLICLFILI